MRNRVPSSHLHPLRLHRSCLLLPSRSWVLWEQRELKLETKERGLLWKCHRWDSLWHLPIHVGTLFCACVKKANNVYCIFVERLTSLFFFFVTAHKAFQFSFPTSVSANRCLCAPVVSDVRLVYVQKCCIRCALRSPTIALQSRAWFDFS